MPPRIEPVRIPVAQPIPVREFAQAAARTAAARPAPADAAMVQPAARAAREAVGIPAQAVRRAAIPTAPAMARAVPLVAPARPAAGGAVDALLTAATAPAARPAAAPGTPTGPAVEPLRQRLPDRVVEMLNAQRGREAVTAMARTTRPVEVAAATPVAAAAEAPQPAQAIAAAPVAEPRVAVEPAAPVIQFAPAPAARPLFAATAGIGEQVRQADARQAFQAAVVAQVAERAQPMGMPTAPRNIIDQRV